jgi:hypothetical protein
VRQRHGQLTSRCGVTQISSLSPTCWSIRHGGSPARWRHLWLSSSVEAVAASGPVAARRQRGAGRRGRLGPVGNAVRRRPQVMGRGVAGGIALRETWRRRGGVGGRTGTATQGENGAASIGVRGMGRADRVVGRATRTGVIGGRPPSVQTSIIIVIYMMYSLRSNL